MVKLVPHYIIPKSFANHPVIEILSKHGLFEAENNTLYLPVNPMVAQQLGVSPFSGRPLDSYMNGIGSTLKRFGDSSEFALARNADKAALKRLEGTVNRFQAAIVDGLKTGRLFLTPPLAPQ
jgi:hypothetical protein